ncbi:MAG: GAF domain-containing protein, partial [Acidobacteria bacterium]|nr:GAF domain-containing protein [Acidobacteriota bacterium]
MSAANPDQLRPDSRQTQELLEHRLAFEKLISGISTNFINVAAAEVDHEIAGALETVGRFVGADRAYIYMLTEDRQTAVLTHEWTADPRASRGIGVHVPMAAFPWTGEQLVALQQVMISIDDLPAEAAAEREAFKRAGNHSIVVVPMIYNREFLGALGIASAVAQTWSEEAASLLRISG